jgi:hypothetical protein
MGAEGSDDQWPDVEARRPPETKGPAERREACRRVVAGLPAPAATRIA